MDGDENAGTVRQLAREDELLLVAAREGAGQGRRERRSGRRTRTVAPRHERAWPRGRGRRRPGGFGSARFSASVSAATSPSSRRSAGTNAPPAARNASGSPAAAAASPPTSTRPENGSSPAIARAIVSAPLPSIARRTRSSPGEREREMAFGLGRARPRRARGGEAAEFERCAPLLRAVSSPAAVRRRVHERRTAELLPRPASRSQPISSRRRLARAGRSSPTVPARGA